MAQVACLNEIEGRQPTAPARPLTGRVRVAAWNVQRGPRPSDAAALLRRTGADVLLLSELDSGMARTDNVDVPAAIASSLGDGYGFGFGVEFVELGLGDVHERQHTEGENARGLHGNAVVVRAPLVGPSALRLDHDARWFAADSPEPRVGGRMAVVTTVELDGTPVRVASTHLENVTDPSGRPAQFEVLVDAMGPGPAVIGGDLNTFGTSFDEITDPDLVRRLHAAEPDRFLWPVAHEPLFEIAADHGFTWADANVAAPTTTHGPLKLYWLLGRGLEASEPEVLDASGLSDHHVVAVTVRLARS